LFQLLPFLSDFSLILKPLAIAVFFQKVGKLKGKSSKKKGFLAHV